MSSKNYYAVGVCVLLGGFLGRPTSAQESTSETAGPLEQVVVTARKRVEAPIDVPISITAFSAETLSELNIRSFDDYATKTPNLSFSYGTAELGFGATRSVAIRGIAGEDTVGVYIDDTPVPDSIDPRVVDIERIEVLKGPQGTLFGQGSLGGNIRIITVQPSPHDTNGYFEVRGGKTSDAEDMDYGVSFAGSHNLVGDAVTARVVAFVDNTAGFLRRAYPNPDGTTGESPNQGADFTYGGSVSVLWQASENFKVTLRTMVQRTDIHGWPAPYAPLPGFAITSLTLNREANVQERTSDTWYLPSLNLSYRGSHFAITSSTSYFDRTVLDTEDASEGTNWYFTNFYGLTFPTNLPIPWDESVPQRRTTNETRISFDPSHGVSGVLGIYYSRQYSNEDDNGHYLPGIAASGLTSFPGYCPGNTTTCPSYGTDLNWYSTYPLHRIDRALFGELYLDWHQWELTLGLRGYRDSQTLNSLSEGAGNGYIVHDDGATTQSGVTPKAALSFKFDGHHLAYASVSKGFREGGVSQPPIAQCGLLEQLGLTPGVPAKYGSDTVWNYEIGGKAESDDGRMILTGAAFQMNWNNIQQAFTLPLCFLGITVNEGAARARGGELEFTGKPLPQLELRAGLGVDDAKITSQSVPGLPAVGSRVVQIPKVTATASGTITQPLGSNHTGFLTADVSYVGDSTTNTGALGYPLTRASYTLVNASIGVRWNRSELSLYAANLTNEHPNLGDLNPAGYVRHESLAADAPTLPRVATLQPFNIGLQYRMQF